MSKIIQPGTIAPDFTLKDTAGNTITLSKLKGKMIVLYFYPKDDTHGCTTQACNIRDNYKSFQDKGILIYGISPDSVESHQKFTDKYCLPFPLFSDPDHVVAKKYGTWGKKQMYGREYEGMFRITYIIGKDMKIVKVFDDSDKVKIGEHSRQIFDALKK